MTKNKDLYFEKSLFLSNHSDIMVFSLILPNGRPCLPKNRAHAPKSEMSRQPKKLFMKK
jgi:hypothetical protein